MAICIQIARRKMCQSTIVKSRLIRKKRSKYHPKTFKHEAQTYPKSLQIRCRNWAPEKVGKSDVPDSFRIIDFGLKSVQNPSSCDLFTIFGIRKSIRKSMPKRYRKSIQKTIKKNHQKNTCVASKKLKFRKNRRRLNRSMQNNITKGAALLICPEIYQNQHFLKILISQF